MAMKDPVYRAAFARRLARLAVDMAAVRAELSAAAHEDYDAGRSLCDFERVALDTLSLEADGVQRALATLAGRLDRDLSDVEPHADVVVTHAKA